MSTFSWMSAPDISSDAAFRKWAQGVHDALVGCGWVQTADTGQVTISTMTAPSTANAAAGYEIFRMNDALQATCPVFVKLEYGRVSATNNTPTQWVTVGQGSNGSGTITGQLLARTQVASTTTAYGSATEYPSYGSCDGAGICLALWSGYTNPGTFFLAIERSRDASGNATGDAVLIALGGQSASLVRVIGNGGVPGASKCADSAFFSAALPATINGANASPASTLSKDGVVAPVFPIACAAPGVTPWVSNVLVAVHPGDAGTTSVIQAATINGEVRTYRAWTVFNTNGGLVIAGQKASNPALCWPAIIWGT